MRTTSTRASDALYFIGQDEWIDYTIRFQNTGTDTAFHVIVTDTLPGTLDLATLEVGAASHAFTWALREQGTLKFRFFDILLPDSNVNEASSHGSVSFRIRPKQPLVPGTVIENMANIYFDFNRAGDHRAERAGGGVQYGGRRSQTRALVGVSRRTRLSGPLLRMSLPNGSVTPLLETPRMAVRCDVPQRPTTSGCYVDCTAAFPMRDPMCINI